MYGSIFRMKVKTGKESEVVKLFDQWNATRAPKVKGAIGGFLLIPEKNADEMVGVALFTSKKSYAANAKDPNQDKWYRKLRSNLKADPDWTDGEYVSGMYTGPENHSRSMR